MTIEIRDVPQSCLPPSVRLGFTSFTAAESDNPRDGDVYDIMGTLYYWDSASGWQQLDGDKNYLHIQGTASTTWVVDHNLGKFPAVTIMDSARRQIVGEVQHVSINTASITFTAATGGSASFN